ncbi:AAA family ATPase [Candidatus Woesearchaeota archaeon ex4484_78]|nr:MAG: AAA family ATPase [Candidatus Woesearchaeota archaeon ex4484_78]
MILKDTLAKVAKAQRETLNDTGIERELLSKISTEQSMIQVLSGIRRSGKSTLLKQLMKKIKNYYYFNFEDLRVVDFTIKDFEKLEAVFRENFEKSNHYFFDEIQNVPEWERYVRQKHDEGKKIIITVSNASLLSKELGTKLTGRHLTFEVFPFSYKEMLKLKGKKKSIKTLKEYINKGGFPEYLKYEKTEILQELLKDILARDIIVRHKIKDVKTLKELTIYLLTNTGKVFSYNKLKETFKIKSTNTIISYISFLEDSFLIFTIPKFDYSYKKIIINPKKTYAIDTGLVKANTASFSSDDGRLLENAVFLHLRRKYKEIFYFKEKKECDFVIKEKNKITQAIQVCYELTEENKQREIEGLQEAMKKFNLKKGTIITMNQKDKINNIEIKPMLEFLTQ